MIDIKKLPEETEEQFLWKVGQMVDSGKIESWASVNDIVNNVRERKNEDPLHQSRRRLIDDLHIP